LRPILKSIIIGTITIVGYLTVVVLTTPALPPSAAIGAAFELNSIIIIGIGVGVGLQIFLTEQSKKLGCRLDVKRKAFGGNSGGIASTSFFSFFSLVPLGCCGWWLYVLSLLPSVVGSGVSAVLIDYSQTLSYTGLAIIFGFNALTFYKFRKERKIQNFENVK
jgi:hypothetical protein